MKRINTIVQSNTSDPQDRNVMHLKGKELKAFTSSGWENIQADLTQENQDKLDDLETAVDDLEEQLPDTYPSEKITHAELVNLRDAGKLVPGRKYRITDYVTTVGEGEPEARSAGHPFDLIVTASSESSLSELARATLHEGDTYFSPYTDCEGWQIWYSLDNDTTRFSWAKKGDVEGIYISDYDLLFTYDKTESGPGYGIRYWYNSEFAQILAGLGFTDVYSGIATRGPAVVGISCDIMGTTGIFPVQAYFGTVSNVKMDANEGKGVIYRMIDEWGNDCPYDFKNVEYKVGTDYRHTFFAMEASPTQKEGTRQGTCRFNRMGAYITRSGYSASSKNLYKLPFNIFGYNCNSNILGDNCHHNTFEYECQSNTLGNNCYNNTIGYMSENSIIGDHCFNNTFGTKMANSTWGAECYNNTTGYATRYNSFGTGCNNNTLGEYCEYNTFGSYCYSNTIEGDVSYNTIGNKCFYNTFGDMCRSISLGNNCARNVLNDHVTGVIIGNEVEKSIFCPYCSYITVASRCSGCQIDSVAKYVTFESGVSNVRLQCSSTTSENNPMKNIHIHEGISGYDFYDPKAITVQVANQDYSIDYYATDSQTIEV